MNELQTRNINQNLKPMQISDLITQPFRVSQNHDE